MEISKEKYLEALETIDTYHKQIMDKVNFIADYGKINIDNFLDWGYEILQPSMYKAISEYKDVFKAKFIEDIEFNKLMDYKNIKIVNIQQKKDMKKK